MAKFKEKVAKFIVLLDGKAVWETQDMTLSTFEHFLGLFCRVEAELGERLLMISQGKHCVPNCFLEFPGSPCWATCWADATLPHLTEGQREREGDINSYISNAARPTMSSASVWCPEIPSCPLHVTHPPRQPSLWGRREGANRLLRPKWNHVFEQLRKLDLHQAGLHTTYLVRIRESDEWKITFSTMNTW